MDPNYELLVQYLPGVNPRSVAEALIREWNSSRRNPLLLFRRSGEGLEPDGSLLAKRLSFSGDREYAAMKLRTSRSRKSYDCAELYFTNPEWKYSRPPPNYCAVTFHHTKIDQGDPPYGCRFLVALLQSLVEAGRAESGYVEDYSIVSQPSIVVARRARAQMRVQHGQEVLPMLHWITYIPSAVRPRFENAQELQDVTLEEMAELSDGGLIVATSEDPPRDKEQHLSVIDEINRNLFSSGLGARDSRT